MVIIDYVTLDLAREKGESLADLADGGTLLDIGHGLANGLHSGLSQRQVIEVLTSAINGMAIFTQDGLDS